MSSKTQDRSIKIGGYVFDEKKHVHQLDGKPLTGVTTVLKVIGKGDVLVNWAANCAVEYIENHLPITSELIWDGAVAKEVFKEARTAHTKKKEKAGDLGTEIHALVEIYIDKCINENNGVAMNVRYENESLLRFVDWATTNKVKFLASEKHVYSERMWIGGICDIICEIDGKRYVGDIKTSKGIYPEAFIQCSAYAECLKEMGEYKDGVFNALRADAKLIPAFDGVVIINLKKDGGFDVQFNYDLEGNLKCFEAALTIYRHMNAITK